MLGEDLVRLLVELGLKPYEARVYLALLSLGEATATDTASLAGIPQPRVYDTLNSLVKKGLVEVKMERPKKYRAVDPAVAIPTLAGSIIKRVLFLQDLLVKKIKNWKGEGQTFEEPKVWVLRELSVSVEKVKQLISSSRVDVMAGLTPSLLERVKEVLVKCAREKLETVYALVIYGGKEAETRGFRDEVVSALGRTNVGLKVRSIPTLPLVLVDGESAVIFAKGYSLEIREAELIRMLSDFFYYSVWKTSSVLKDFTMSAGDRVNTTQIWLAIELIQKIRERGLTPRLRVRGRFVETGEEADLEGVVLEAKIDPEGTLRTLRLKTGDGKVYSVGGLGACIEDVEAGIFTLKAE